MAGIKRPIDSNTSKMSDSTSSSPYLPMFEHFRKEIDEHHDRRERIIKASRDLTAQSKKIVRHLNSTLPKDVTTDITTRKQEISNLFFSISQDVQGSNAWRYQRQISPGIQEYIEALSFEHYLVHQTLITPREASHGIPGHVRLTEDDYVLGIFDLVGEMMRFGITQIATLGFLPGGARSSDGGGMGMNIRPDSSKTPQQRDILTDLRMLRSHFESLNTRTNTGGGGGNAGGGQGLAREIEKKMEVMKTSVEKVENAVYGIILRGRERPKGWIPTLMTDEGVVPGGREMVENYQ
ncbi:MAG: hypothetical protein M1823_000179 [Watsoniomyces obsoletus]|nr:MAG: hypothetical protein M1823_000179 [Watsoniomyces obsoletus]